MVYKEDVEDIITKLQGKIERLVTAQARAEEKIDEAGQEITVLKSLMEGLPRRQPKLFSDGQERVAKRLIEGGVTLEIKH
jgi:hypothetical protein